MIDGSGTVLHTYSITLGESNNVDDSEYLAKALDSAAHGQLVPDAALGTITTRIHTGPGGQMTAYRDDLQRHSETKAGLEQAVRQCGYLLREKKGRPEDRAEEDWYPALGEHLRERATPVAI